MTRRDSLKTAGSVAVAVAVGRGSPVTAQEASPEASPASGDELEGRFFVVRSRTLTSDSNAEEVLATIAEGFVPLLREIDGFVAYLAVADPTSRQTAFVTICADKTGTDASTSRGADWLTDNGYEFFEGDPIVVEGPIGVAAGSLPTSAAGATSEAEATPATGGGSSGGYVVIRSRKLKADRSADELLRMVRDGFLPLVTDVPGFTAYLAVANTETRDQFGIGVYMDKAGADESTSRAAEWGKLGAADFVEGDPIVVEGALALAVSAI